MDRSTCTVFSLGVLEYSSAWEIQNAIAAQIRQKKRPNTILLVQHPNVYTIGRRGIRTDVFLSNQELKDFDIQLIETDRGGEVTYHGPGQLIVYPIIDIRGLGGPSNFVRLLQSAIIDVLEQYQLVSYEVCRRIGVWVSYSPMGGLSIYKDNKIAAIGLRINRGISTHGFALNVNPDLSYFEQIIPCGIRDSGVTSMVKELGTEIDVKLLEQKMIMSLSKYLDMEITYGENVEFYRGLYSL